MTMRWMSPNSSSGAGRLMMPFSEAGNTGGGQVKVGG